MSVLAAEKEETPKPLIGTDEATIDTKGRVSVSKKKRDRLGDGFAMCLGESGCLVAYPGDQWSKIVSEIFQSELTNPGRLMFTRLILGTADDELEFDKEGRVVIPHKLRTLAKIEKEVVLIGCGERLEIWGKEEYEKYLKEGDDYNRERREQVRKARKEMKLE